MSGWTVGLDPSVNLDSWAEDKEPEAVTALRAWLVRCGQSGPPFDAWLYEIEDQYRYRYWLAEVNVTVDFIAVTHERWMLVKRVD